MLTGVVLSIGGCESPSGGDANPGNGSSDGETVVLTVEHRSRWRELRIEGTTDLPDGAVVSYHVAHALADELPRNEWPAQNLIVDGGMSLPQVGIDDVLRMNLDRIAKASGG